MQANELLALSLSVMAGLATLIGSVIIIFTKQSNTKFLSASLGFSAGVMLYVSIVEIYSKSKLYLCDGIGERPGNILAAASFFGGIILIGLIDYLIPSTEGDIGNYRSRERSDCTLKRMGLLTAIAIGIHNFPDVFDVLL